MPVIRSAKPIGDFNPRTPRGVRLRDKAGMPLQ